MLCPVVAIVGATATGKSALGLEIAQWCGGEIVNADAMALYRGMDIGTAKTPVNERRGIAHHQLDVLDPTEEASVAVYQERARRDIRSIRQRGNTPVVVGGSGLYIRALLDELNFPGTDPELRQSIENRLAEIGAEALHAELAAKDPEAAATIDAANTRRVVRALEVGLLTGKPFAASMPKRQYVTPTIQLGLEVPGEILDQRIRKRASQMIDDGLIEEVAGLGTLGATASRATGYAQALAHLAGELTILETIEAIALATRQLARRQIKWFRRDPRITWLDGTDPAGALTQAQKLITNACSDTEQL